jgi:tetratricopeptide (TPR) repeat protein
VDDPLTEGLRLRTEGRLIEALDRLKDAHRLQPTAETAYWTAVTYDNLGAEVLAIPLYRESLDQGLALPLRAHALAYLASSLTKCGRAADALAPIREALTLLPDTALFWSIAGEAFLARGEWAQAEDRFREALKRDEGLGQAWRGLGQALGERGDPAGAEAAFRRAWALAYYG